MCQRQVKRGVLSCVEMKWKANILHHVSLPYLPSLKAAVCQLYYHLPLSAGANYAKVGTELE